MTMASSLLERDETTAINHSVTLPSPTLTNPDMILPYENERETSTPSPPFELRLPARDLDYFPNSSNCANDTSSKDKAFDGQSSTFVGMAVSFESPSDGPDDYGDAKHVRNGSTGQSSSTSAHQDVLGSERASRTTWHENDDDHDDDSDSSSTISASSDILRLSPYDREVMGRSTSPISPMVQFFPEKWNEVESSNILDRRGVASTAHFRSESDRMRMGAIAEEDEEEEEEEEEGDADNEDNSSTLSNEAEHILENAKKRLTHMEGNLTRARSSIRMSPSPSPYSSRSSLVFQNGLSKPLVKGDRRSQTSLAGALLRRASQSRTGLNSSHNRGSSDNFVPSSTIRRSVTGTTSMRDLRSFSALGSTNASGFGASDVSPFDEQLSDDKAANTTSTTTFSYIYPNHTTLEISQHRNSPFTTSDTVPTPPSSGSDKKGLDEQQAESPVANGSHTASTSRSNSSANSHPSFQHQMDDLKTRLSSPKEKSHNESTVRTPSPVVAAEQWCKTSSEYIRKASITSLTGPPSVTLKSDDGEELGDNNISASGSDGKGESLTSEDQEPTQKEETHAQENDEQLSDDDDQVESASPDSEEDEVPNEVSEEPLEENEDDEIDEAILEEFPSVVPSAETIRHEDREDAFDYEHFILHSALGNYTKFIDRRESYGSVDSVETARPNSQVIVADNQNSHERKNSVGSISSAASFETAAEGNYSPAPESPIETHKSYWNGCEDAHSYIRQQQLNYSDHTLDYTDVTREIDYPADQDSASTPSSRSSTPVATTTPDATLNFQFPSTQSTPKAPKNNPDAPTSGALVESIISLAAANVNSDSGIYPLTYERLDESDAALMQDVVQRLGNISLELLRASTSDIRSSIDNRIVTLLRRRLEATRKVLDGEIEV